MEFLDVVDESDNILRSAPRKEVYENLLTHRIAHVIVFDSEGKMALQMRSSEVSFCPLHWCTTAGGHVRSGETYEQAALRELKEETGKTLRIVFAHKDLYEYKNNPRKGLKKFLATFTAKFDGPFSIDKKDVDRIEFFTLGEIQKMINKGEKFHPELLFLLKKYYGIK